MRLFFQKYEGKVWTSYDTDTALSEIFKYYGELNKVRESCGIGASDDFLTHLGIENKPDNRSKLSIVKK